jgi:AhpD family alkylhydroperoxidase
MAEYFYDVAAAEKISQLAAYVGPSLQMLMELNEKIMADGALSRKTKELIAVACAHMTRCPYCIDEHTKQAVEAGASEAEIAEAIMVAVALSMGAPLAHSSIALKALGK